MKKTSTKRAVLSKSVGAVAVTCGISYYLLLPYIQAHPLDKGVLVPGLFVSVFVIIVIRALFPREKRDANHSVENSQTVWFGKGEKILIIVFGVIFLLITAAASHLSLSK